ncbi:hypothetical protein [Sneathiella sp.]|uniref:hypothetical protein n=1 Tax=Sneathiella sp. TaxID=1964365 RepID=UPI002600123D|nr:hypothetical protein [Sneathiella sp.]
MAVSVFRERLLLAKDKDIGSAWLVSTLDHLGKITEAQKVWADFRLINLEFPFGARLLHLAFTDPSFAEKVMAGLAKAGLTI